MGKGSTSSTVSVPQYIEDAARRNLGRADDISKIGYTPYYGPDVAAFSPNQQAAFQNTADTAGAFGMAGAPIDTYSATGQRMGNIGRSTAGSAFPIGMSQQDIMGGMPSPTTYAGGVRGYSSAPMFEQSLETLAEKRPGQYDYINSMFIDPVTGLPGSRVGENIDYTQPLPVDGGGAGGSNNNDSDPFNIAPSYSQYDFSGQPSGYSDSYGFVGSDNPQFMSGGGADEIGNYGKVGDFFGGIGDATGITNYDGSDPDPDRPSGNDGGKVICAAMNKMGLLPDDIYALDSEFGIKVNRDDPMLGDGYRLWALPVSEFIKKDTLGARAFRAFLLPITLAWAKEMAHQMRPEEYKPNYAGKVIMAIGHPTCRVIGHVFIGGLTKRDV